MIESEIVVKKFLCDYCKCIFVASRTSYESYDIGPYEKSYRCVCPMCHRVATRVLGTELRTIQREGQKLLTIKDLKKNSEEKS